MHDVYVYGMYGDGVYRYDVCGVGVSRNDVYGYDVYGDDVCGYDVYRYAVCRRDAYGSPELDPSVRQKHYVFIDICLRIGAFPQDPVVWGRSR